MEHLTTRNSPGGGWNLAVLCGPQGDGKSRWLHSSPNGQRSSAPFR